MFVARDGTQLLARHWAPPGDVKAVVVIMHGLKDYSARYAALATRLAATGYAVYAFDLRGHGRSAGPRVAPDDWTDYVDDLDRFLTSVEKREPGKPVFVFGHSMGGAIAARAAELHRPVIAGLALSGPAIAIDAPPLLIAATRMTAYLLPHAPALKLPNGDFSSDPANAAAMDRDEWISQPPGPASTAAGLVDGMRAIWEDADHLTMPVLAMHGTRDRLTAPSGSRALIAAIPSRDKTLRIYEGYFHDLLHEPNTKAEGDLVAWLDAHTGGAAVAAPPIYAGHLDGDPRGWTQEISIVGGISHTPATRIDIGPEVPAAYDFAGRLAVNLARPRPFGWYGALSARIVDGHYVVALRPIGVAVHTGGTVLGVSGGGSLVTGTTLALSAGAWLEQSLGPVHLGGFAEIDHRDASVYFVGGSLRAGGDRHYWPRARAGVGPVISGGAECTTIACGWFVALGVELYGAD